MVDATLTSALRIAVGAIDEVYRPTFRNVDAALNWLSPSFLFVGRLRREPCGL
jgi:hypothetical protein